MPSVDLSLGVGSDVRSASKPDPSLRIATHCIDESILPPTRVTIGSRLGVKSRAVSHIADLLATGGEARPTDIARRLGVSHATAINTISRLKREGLAKGLPYRGVFLTEMGQALAERTRNRHRIVVDVLVALGVPTEIAEADAEGIEHHVSEVTLKAFAHFLQAPGTGMRPGKR